MREYIPVKQQLAEAKARICELEDQLEDLRRENEGLRFRCGIYRRELEELKANVGK